MRRLENTEMTIETILSAKVDPETLFSYLWSIVPRQRRSQPFASYKAMVANLLGDNPDLWLLISAHRLLHLPITA